MIARPWVLLGSAIVAGTLLAGDAVAQTPATRDAISSLRFDAIEFEPPTPDRYELEGVQILLLEDRSLPLVSMYARFNGGYGLFDRSWYAVAFGLPTLLRYGGTESMTPDSVDAALDYWAIQTSFGTGGGSISSTVNTLTEHLGTTMELWTDLLTRPRFDTAQIELWRLRELEGARRRLDDPGSLAFAEFNRLMYGDHPVGWEMEPADLTPERLTAERFREAHRRVLCRENLILGVTGDVSWAESRPLFERFIASVPPCAEPLPEDPEPDIRREPGVFVIERDLEQTVIVMAHPTSLNLADDPSYFAATIGNSILGGGGFSSRLLARVRTEEGFAYSASSLWTTPRRHDGLVGALTSTSPENAVPAVQLILTTMEELRDTAPSRAELRTAVDRVVNGFVFNFQTPGQIVSRLMLYLAEEMPEDWLERYVAGIQRVEPEHVRRVFAEHLRPGAMTILLVGDPARMGRSALESLGPVSVLDADRPRP